MRHTLWLIAVGMTGDRHLAEDIVQESLTIAWKKVEQFDPATSFSAWTASIVRNVTLNARRKKAKQSYVSPDHLNSTHSKDIREHDAPISVRGGVLPNQDQFDDQVVAALNHLSGSARSCLLLRTVSGLSYDLIAELLEIAPGTAMSHVFRARQAMRKHLCCSASADDGATRKTCPTEANRGVA